MPNNIDRRSYPIELRNVSDSERRISGHAAVFNSLSEEMCGFRELIRPGAFANAIATSDVRALWNHNPDYVLGRSKSGTLRMHEDGTGLAVEIDPPDTQFARDLITSMQRGDIDQMSFAFVVGQERWYTDDQGMTIREILTVDELYDVSPVTYPAYSQTDVSARTQEAFAEYRSKLDAGGSAGPAPTPDTAGAAARARQLDIAERELLPIGGNS